MGTEDELRTCTSVLYFLLYTIITDTFCQDCVFLGCFAKKEAGISRQYGGIHFNQETRMAVRLANRSQLWLLPRGWPIFRALSNPDHRRSPISVDQAPSSQDSRDPNSGVCGDGDGSASRRSRGACASYDDCDASRRSRGACASCGNQVGSASRHGHFPHHPVFSPDLYRSVRKPRQGSQSVVQVLSYSRS